MILNRQDFEEGTAFELYVLETVRPAIELHGGASIDLRGSATVAAVKISINETISGPALDGLKDQLSPLLFGATWKVLDLLLEFALNAAGLTPARHDWLIAEKQLHASNVQGDRAVLGCSQRVWQALLSVYANTVEHRHCLVHRTAKVDPATGTLDGVDRNQNPLRSLTRGQQVALAKAAALAARGALSGGIDKRSEDHLTYQLDQLTSHMGALAFGVVGGASAPVDIYLELSQENGVYLLDMTGVLERARRTFPTVAHFDILVDAPDGSARKLFGYAEDCPPGRSTLDLAALPPWLTYR
jgi:hypothetical protein